ncbi:MAG: hypothetical protein CMJ83_13625 [Planctomycetes bacterium]|nr:hypothetical protein [Planctomycetota bacterium]
MDRRSLLIRGLCGPLAFGLHELTGALPERPEWMREAQAAMRSSGRPGLVLVIPDDAPGRDRITDALIDVLTSPDHAALRGRLRGKWKLAELLRSPRWPEPDALLGAVWICMRRKTAAALLPRCSEDATVVLLDAGGRRIAERRDDLVEFLGRFPATVEALLHGPDEKRLSATVRRLQGSLPAKTRDDVWAALRTIHQTPGDATAKLVLRKHSARILPWLIAEARRGENAEVTQALREIIWTRGRKYIWQRAPFGVKISNMRGGRPPPCATCGLAVRLDRYAGLIMRYLH